jgi:hypothetical protein
MMRAPGGRLGPLLHSMRSLTTLSAARLHVHDIVPHGCSWQRNAHVTSKTYTWRWGEQPLDVAEIARDAMFHLFHVNRGDTPKKWRNNLGGGGKPKHQKWAMFTLESNANYPIQEDQSFLSS